MKKLLIILLSLFSVISCAAQDITSLRSKADNGSSEAQYQVGEWFCKHHSQINYELGLKYLRAAAKQGNQDAIKLISEITSPGYEAWAKCIYTHIMILGLSLNQKKRFSLLVLIMGMPALLSYLQILISKKETL